MKFGYFCNTTNWNHKPYDQLLNETQEKFNKIKIETPSNIKEAEVIFILGMPRSGTSLIEQIITSHSNVFGGGELPILSNIIKCIPF